MKGHYLNGELEKDFVREAARINHMAMTGICVFFVIVELCNILNVLCFSPSGLETINNRIYFGFYSFFLVISCLYLVSGRRDMEEERRYRLTLICGSIFVMGQTIFNLYDVSSSFSPGKIMALVTLVAFSAIGVMKPWYAVLNIGLNFAALIPWLFVQSGMEYGLLFNYVLTAVTCFVIYFIRFHSIRTQLLQKEEITDMSRRLEKSRKQFRLSSEQYELILQKSHLVAFEWNIEKGDARFSREWAKVFGKESHISDAEKFIREGHSLKRQPKAEILLCMENLRNGMPYQKRDLLLPVADGSERWFELHLVLQTGWEGMPNCGIGLLVDIMDQRQRIVELEKELQRDAFTRLLNKTAMESYGIRKLGELQGGERLYMLILDLDHFKGINDRYGHLCGDHVLQEVARLMRDKAPDGARIGRLGGDEFGALLATEKRGREFVAYAERLTGAVSGIRWEGREIGESCSVGIAVSRQGERSWNRLYGEADRALYMAKRTGRGRVYYTLNEGPPQADRTSDHGERK